MHLHYTSIALPAVLVDVPRYELYDLRDGIENIWCDNSRCKKQTSNYIPNYEIHNQLQVESLQVVGGATVKLIAST
ncbi:hypothetical protein FRX31_026236 [Thalictrum thalictroides]|uniref:Uncharacterized protein n=1 Tax=Thalictrum thalictroides TaxID=46969 RepID=A0A7J6VGF1_THATH|nr:hypothetical protein FRX31_026236 [Thalictrum thalictroides]